MVVFGGPHASFYDVDLLETTNADIVVRGEGEFTFYEIVEYFFHQRNSLNSPNSLSEIHGITYRDHDRIIRNPDRPFIEDLSNIPFPERTLIGRSNHSKHTAIITGRGCPNRCAFCFESFHGKKYRVRDIEEVIREIRYLHENLGYRYISIVDDTFVAHPERIRQFCRRMKEMFNVGNELIWFALARVDTLAKNLSLIKEMKDAGLVRLQIGIESGNQEHLDIYKKNIRLEQVRQVVTECNAVGLLSIFGNFIIGNPFETEETFQRSLDFALELMDMAPGRMECSVGYLTPYAGTDIRVNPDLFGIKIIDPDLKTGTAVRFPFCETEALSKEKLVELRARFEQEIEKKMAALTATLPLSLIMEHLGRLKFDLETEWASLFQQDSMLKLLYKIRNTPIYIQSEELTIETIYNLVPVFIGEINILKKMAVFSSLFQAKQLNEWGLTLARLCRGKLSFNEVLDVFYKYYEGNLPEKEILVKHVLEFMRQLEKAGALVFLDI